MKEILELRVNYDYAHLLFKPDEGKNLGTSVRIVEISKDDLRYKQIPVFSKLVKEKYNTGFFFSWRIKRKYSIEEFEKATLFCLKIKTTFEPAGEECGTMYDETTACEICGADRKQISQLTLKRGCIPKKDIARTIAGEVVVSAKFIEAFKQCNLKGAVFEPVVLGKEFSNYYQLVASSPELELTRDTIAGDNPFETSNGSIGGSYSYSGYNVIFEPEVYKCPLGHTIGLNLLSEPYVFNSQSISNFDFFVSKQKVGVKRGLLRPEPIYFCSKAFRRMVEEERLSGFDFEVANVG